MDIIIAGVISAGLLILGAVFFLLKKRYNKKRHKKLYLIKLKKCAGNASAEELDWFDRYNYLSTTTFKQRLRDRYGKKIERWTFQFNGLVDRLKLVLKKEDEIPHYQGNWTPPSEYESDFAGIESFDGKDKQFVANDLTEEVNQAKMWGEETDFGKEDHPLNKVKHLHKPSKYVGTFNEINAALKD